MATKTLKNLAVDQGDGQQAPTSTDAFLKEDGVGNPEWCTAAQLEAFVNANDGALAAKDTIATDDIDDNAISDAKLAHGTANALRGFDGSGVPGEVTAGSGIEITGNVISATGGGGGDAAPTQDTSDAATYALADASRMHLNVQVRSHQADVDFEVADDASAGSAWWVFFDHDGCTISVNGDAGSVNGVSGGSVQGVNGGWAVVSVKSNAGSAPVVEVKGDIIVPTDSTGVKTYDNEDHGQDFSVTGGDQTFSAKANYANGFYVNLFNDSDAQRTIVGNTNNATLRDPGSATVKRIAGRLVVTGDLVEAGTVELDP